MPQDPAPMDQLRGEPLRFLETEQFQEMLSVYRKLKPLEQENPRKFRNQLNTYDFSDICNDWLTKSKSMWDVAIGRVSLIGA